MRGEGEAKDDNHACAHFPFSFSRESSYFFSLLHGALISQAITLTLFMPPSAPSGNETNFSGTVKSDLPRATTVNLRARAVSEILWVSRYTRARDEE